MNTMYSKTILTTVLFIGVCSVIILPCHAQIDSTVNSIPKTLYNQPTSPTSCVENLEHLFKSWPIDDIINAKDIELMSYTSHGTLRDTTQINYYANLMTQLNSPFLSIAGYQTSGYLGTKGYHVKELRITTYKQILENVPIEHMAKAQEDVDNQLLTIRMGIILALKPGHRIFSIKLKYKGEEMENFIFCDPQSNEVVVDFLFKSISL